jgi:uncharacterized membrane protein
MGGWSTTTDERRKEVIEVAKIEASVQINRPIEEVFAFAGNIENNPQWQSGVLEAEVTSEGPIAVGTTYRYVTRLLGRQIETDGEITEYEPNRRYSFKSTSGPFPIGGRLTCEAADGGTKVTLVVAADIGGFFKMAEPLVVRMVKRQYETDVSNLKSLLEAQA